MGLSVSFNRTLRHLLEYVQAQSNTKGHSFNLARFLLVSMIIPAIKAPLLFEVVRGAGPSFLDTGLLHALILSITYCRPSQEGNPKES